MQHQTKSVSQGKPIKPQTHQKATHRTTQNTKTPNHPKNTTPKTTKTTNQNTHKEQLNLNTQTT